MREKFLRNYMLAGVASAAITVAAWSSPALATTLTFSEYPTGTIVTNQYASEGVLFSAGPISASAPVITTDGAMPDSPVLSPVPPFAGDFNITFTDPATHNVSFQSGSWDTVGSGVIDVYAPGGALLAALSNTTTGVETFDLSGYGNIGSIYFNSNADGAGADIDNLSFTVPEPATLTLLGTALALLGMGGAMRRRRRKGTQPSGA